MGIVKTKTTMDIDRELLGDIEKAIIQKLREGKSCGGLRISDSHEMRIRYLFEFWKGEFVYGGIQRRFIEESQKNEKLKKMKEKIDKIIRDGVG